MGNVYPSPSPHELFSALSRLSARMPWPISAPMLCAAGRCAPCLGQRPLGWTPLVLLQRSAPYICPSRHPRIKHSTPGCLWLYLNPGSLRWRADSARMEFLCSYSSDRPKKWAPIKKIQVSLIWPLSSAFPWRLLHCHGDLGRRGDARCTCGSSSSEKQTLLTTPVMPPLLTCALQNYFSAHLGLASRPIRPHFLSPEGGFAPFLPLPRSPGGRPGGRQLTWLSKALFYPLYWNPVLPPAPLGPTRSRRHPALLCPLCHGSHRALHMKATVHGYRGKENAKKETVAKSYLFFFFFSFLASPQ